ncbi:MULTISPECIES: hypothetical protein [Rhizobium]|uniref:Uncharacterized protein n=1 Tax=Rhizobium aouanii TaxID=3118145 RepID=A0ABU8CW22_9HYPH|nr:hypothetical protein [Rhizobium acaciae]MCW1754918.1 hypothetical protein [Rhizobium acaciae]
MRSNRELLELAYLRCPARKEKVTQRCCKINEPQFRERPGLFSELVRCPGLRVMIMRRRIALEALRFWCRRGNLGNG